MQPIPCIPSLHDNPMFHIIGTNHELQHSASPFRAPAAIVDKAREDFRSYLRRLAAELRPDILAEEFSQEVLDIKRAISQAKIVANELRIQHRFCDPGIGKRQELGLATHGTEDCEVAERRRYDVVRETYWIDALSDVLDQTIIFICGAEHVFSLAQLLRERRVAVSVAMEYFGQEIYCS